MTAPDLVRGWCPSLFRPMESGDGWLARVRPQAGVVSAELALAVAEAARRYGNGLIEVTNRANIQIRGLQPATIAPFTAAIEAAGGAAGEGSFVLVSPLMGADSTLAAETGAIASAVNHAVKTLDRVGPRNKPTAAPPADDDRKRVSPAGPDPRVYPSGRSALPTKFCIVVDGGGALPLAGISLDITIRFRDGQWRVNGAACAVAEIPARVNVLARDGAPRITTRSDAAPKPGFHAMGQTGFALLAPAFGQMAAETLAGLAHLAQTYGDGKLRPTPWKSLCLAGVSHADAPALLDAAASLGFITDAGDGRLSIATCAGSPACARGEADTRCAAAELARTRRAGDSLLHLSGCAKGCAHPGAAPVTLVGRGGHFDLIRHGRAGDMPAIRDLALAEIPPLVQSLLP